MKHVGQVGRSNRVRTALPSACTSTNTSVKQEHFHYLIAFPGSCVLTHSGKYKRNCRYDSGCWLQYCNARYRQPAIVIVELLLKLSWRDFDSCAPFQIVCWLSPLAVYYAWHCHWKWKESSLLFDETLNFDNYVWRNKWIRKSKQQNRNNHDFR